MGCIMNLTYLFFNYWHFNIAAAIIIAALGILHFITNGYKLTKKSLNFICGLLLLFLLTFSPLDFIGHYYLFSAHMIQHIILLLIIPPLLLTGTNKEFLQKMLSGSAIPGLWKFLFFPVVAWLFGVSSMWIWHAPILFKAMMQSHFVHVIEMVSLLLCGLIFSWPVFSPLEFRKLNPLYSSLYLFTACIGCTILGIFITFAPAGYFSSYMTGSNSAILNFLQFNLGLTPDADQQAAGLIMWVPACLIYLTIIMIMMAKWYSTKEEFEEDELNEDRLHFNK